MDGLDGLDGLDELDGLDGLPGWALPGPRWDRVYRRLPWAVGRIVPVRHSCHICVRRCYHSPNINLRSVKLLLE